MSSEPASDARRRGRPRDSERDGRRRQILDAAVARFIASGFGRTSIDDIAADARVTKRTIYTSFGDKAELFTAAIERFRIETLAAASPDETLEALAARIVHTLHSDEAVGLHRLMIAESPQFPELAAAFYAGGPQGWIDVITARLGGRDARAGFDSGVGSGTHSSSGPYSGSYSDSDSADRAVAEALVGLLLGEAHRKRLLGLTTAPSRADARTHADRALELLGVAGLDGPRS
ncbi:TetR/AcrR family transcriptional regulator [Plantibacter sp. YIM 135347]|uniref:TetR/AcrR family transcriptional regulator n=1 Tax=Plantibacter sp. YIM 135347 TaxID=3423919 RepID=UPI003D34A5B0